MNTCVWVGSFGCSGCFRRLAGGGGKYFEDHNLLMTSYNAAVCF